MNGSEIGYVPQEKKVLIELRAENMRAKSKLSPEETERVLLAYTQASMDNAAITERNLSRIRQGLSIEEDRKKEPKIRKEVLEMKDGEHVYTVPWSVKSTTKEEYYIDKNCPVINQCEGTAELPLTRMGNRLLVNPDDLEKFQDIIREYGEVDLERHIRVFSTIDQGDTASTPKWENGSEGIFPRIAGWFKR